VISPKLNRIKLQPLSSEELKKVFEKYKQRIPCIIEEKAELNQEESLVKGN